MRLAKAQRNAGSSCEEAQKVIQMIVEVAGECRLNINKGKNNVLFMARFNKGRAIRYL